jgi:hypothetical protein
MRRRAEFTSRIAFQRQQPIWAPAEHFQLRSRPTLHRRHHRIRATAVNSDEKNAFAAKRALLARSMCKRTATESQREYPSEKP